MCHDPIVRAVAFVLVASVAVGLPGCGPSAYKITPVPTDRTLKETVVHSDGGFAPPKIALIDVSGILLNGPEFTLFGEGENPVSLFVEKLDKAAKDRKVAAIIVRINSPGGSVGASDLMYDELMRYKGVRKPDKPIIAVLMDVAASGGYYVACACDEIVAHRTTVTGSIGVIMQTVNFEGTLKKIGVETLAIKSGKMKDAGSPLRGMSDEERELFQALVDEFYERFVEVVAAGRGKTPEEVRDFADGRVYTAKQALELGLVDRIGTLRDAIDISKQHIGARRVKVVSYHRPLGWKPNVYAESPSRGDINVSLLSLPGWHPFMPTAPRFLYLWAPGVR